MTRLSMLGVVALWGMAAGEMLVKVSDVAALSLQKQGLVASSKELLGQSAPEVLAGGNTVQVIASSWNQLEPSDMAIKNGQLYASSDSFVRGAIDAWAHHQQLILRPEVIWFEILAQLNLYAAKHAEELRHLFVDFEGKKEIVVRELTWQRVIDAFRGEIQSRVKTAWLRDWITPGFSTSTANDNTTASVLMMGMMQQYFQFTGGIICGLPAVRLEGERDDWHKLLVKLDQLHKFGSEPAQYARNLKPILQRFVKTWDEPKSEATRAFWKQIVRADRVMSCGAGPIEYEISGWITGFMHWTANGDVRVQPLPAGVEETRHLTTLDGIKYYPEGLDQLPVGYAKAPFKILDYPQPGAQTKGAVVAGNIGIAKAEPGVMAAEAVAQPLSAWFLYAPAEEAMSVNTGMGWGRIGNHTELFGIFNGIEASCPSKRGGQEWSG
ncbi:hypothetical protein CDD81_538 [Ophiocordyceps australis]|uniref:DUF4419 domain-containing protein n=1 Tax=Ophiocordyceps australis TaxID=1399860 RepID=A0A2C5YEH9_9HYPO|nr:hypothetical protein CDD81_538 [Ophiocordyceps australis]